MFLVFIKPIINKFRYMRIKDYIYFFVFIALIILPTFLLKLDTTNVNFTIPTINNEKLASLVLFVFAVIVYNVSNPNYKRLSSLLLPEYMTLFNLVRNRYKTLLFFSQAKKLLGNIFVSISLLFIYCIMLGESFQHICSLIILVSSILIFVRICPIVLPALISCSVTNQVISYTIKFLAFALMIVSIVFYFTSYEYRFAFLPHYVLATSFSLIFSGDAYIAVAFVIILLLLYSSIILLIFLLSKHNNINLAKIYESSLYQSELQNKVSHGFVGFTQMYFFLPKQLRVIAAKETLQFLNEYYNLVLILFNTLLLIIIVLIGKNAIPFSFERVILFSSVAYISFYVGLTSLGRDINNTWMYKHAYHKFVKIAVAKYISSLVNSIFSFLFFTPIILLAILFTKNSIMQFFMEGFHWSLAIVPFASISLGMLVSSILPVKLRGSDEKIMYSYNSIEGMFYLLVVLLVAAPLVEVENAGKMYFIVLLIIYFIITVCAIIRVGKKLKE